VRVDLFHDKVMNHRDRAHSCECNGNWSDANVVVRLGFVGGIGPLVQDADLRVMYLCQNSQIPRI